MDRKREILSKLEQIQEQAELTLDELTLQLSRDRLRLIISLARYLTSNVLVNWEDPEGKQASAPAAGDAKPPQATPQA